MGGGSELRQFRAQQLFFGGGWLRFRAVLIPTRFAAWGLGANNGSFVLNGCFLVGVGYVLGIFCARGLLLGRGLERKEGMA